MKTMRHAALLGALLIAACSLSAAERTGPEPSELIYPSGSTTADKPAEAERDSPVLAPGAMPGGMTRSFGYILAIGLLLGGAWLLLKRGSLPRPFAKSGGKLQVLESRMLGNRQFLMVVEYEDAKMLIGVCPGRIDYLTPLAGHPLAGAPAGEDEAPEAFAPVLRGEAQ